ncbi:GIY-YIG nuclease family protein [Chloroflexota bacterium]
MFWNRNKPTVCTYWDCHKEAREGDTLCGEHYKMWEEGFLDKCPRCTRLKDTIYYLCLDCYVGRKIKKKKLEPRPVQGLSERLQQIENPAGDQNDSVKCFVYILEVGDGTLYVGYTKDIQDRLNEVRKPKKSTGTAQPPKLRYLEFIRSMERAKTRVLELREFAAHHPSYIDSLSKQFYQNMEEVGFDISR